jgi:hypothetical protein
VAIDPRKMRPGELCRLLNSTAQGEVINERLLYRHRTRAGFRIGDGRHVDLVRYVAWLAADRHAPQDRPAPADYDDMKEAARARNAAKSQAGRDIGELPPVRDAKRKAAAEFDFRAFCDGYFPQTFAIPWSPDHLKLMGKIEQAVLYGGLFAMASPRGTGKTVLVETACIWAVLYGHRDFVCLIGSDEGHAEEMLESIKIEFESNPLLLADFPEVCHPIARLEGIANRCAGQLYQGKRTRISWTQKEIHLPTIPESKASGAIISARGLTGRIRGMKAKRDGRPVRPSLVVLDDPQTDESARSVPQSQAREAILAGAVLGLAGPGQKIAGIMPCTVIKPGDMADRILDREKHPEWNGERTKMVYEFPADTALWERYKKIRAEGFREGDGGRAGTAFYREHREAMDAGARVAWPDRYNHDELSAIQHAMNLLHRDERAFFAEYQNEPLSDQNEADTLGAAEIAGKLNGFERHVLPAHAAHLTMFIDIQAAALFYVICAWEPNFAGYVVDYGTWPDQREPYFTLRDARRTLDQEFPTQGLEGRIYSGLQALAANTLGREWVRDGGGTMRIERCLIDANWGNTTDVIYQFCRQSSHAALLIPGHGRFVGASSIPFAQYKKHAGDRVGLNWRIPRDSRRRRVVRHVLYDTNWWKSFCQARLAVAIGDPGCLSLFGAKPERHRLFADHLTSEYRVLTEGRGRKVEEWKLHPGRDNHWLDGLVGCAVGASIQGVELEALKTTAPPPKPKERLKLSDIQRQKRGRP